MAIGNDKGSYFVYWKENGRQKKKYFGSGPVNKRKAEIYNKKKGFGVRKKSAPAMVLFGQFMDEYFRHIRARQKNTINLKNIEWKFTGCILPFLGSKDVYGLIHADLDDYVIHRKEQPIKGKNPDAPKRYPKQVTINREIDEIQSYLNWCVSNHKILKNPFVGYKRPSDDREVIQPPSIQEINLLVEKALHHLKRFILISYYLGTRPGPIEMSALKWDHVDWDRKQIIIRSADKKGLNSRRVDIHDSFYETLHHWFLEDRNNPKVDCGYIINYRNKPISSIKKAFNSAKEKAGITRRLRPYDLRHAHVTHQLDEGADLKAVSQNVGHKSVDTTRKVYQHVSSRLQKEAIQKLPEIKTEDTKFKVAK